MKVLEQQSIKRFQYTRVRRGICWRVRGTSYVSACSLVGVLQAADTQVPDKWQARCTVLAIGYSRNLKQRWARRSAIRSTRVCSGRTLNLRLQPGCRCHQLVSATALLLLYQAQENHSYLCVSRISFFATLRAATLAEAGMGRI